MNILEERHTNREFLLRNSRDIVRMCSVAIVSVHTGDIARGIEHLDNARLLLSQYRPKAEGGLRMYLSVPEQEITEAACLIAVVRKESIPSRESLLVAEEPYVLGLLDCVGELKRLTLDMIRAGNIAEANRIFDITVGLYDGLSGFALYGNTVKDIRKKIDAARIMIDGMRAVVVGMPSRR